jgi:tRNA/rRNA methyltransferase
MDIIAQEWKTPGNIGALARAMKNFEFTQLVLLNPDCDHLSKQALDRSTKAESILRSAQVVKNLENYDVLVGTTSALGTTYNMRRNPITAEEFAKKDLRGKVGLIIGREGDGLSNEDLEKCDILVTIPTAKSYPVMNVSHAATVIMYEVFKVSSNVKVTTHIEFATKEDRERLENLIEEKVGVMPFVSDHKRKTQVLLWKKLVGKSNLTKREMMALYGFIRKIRE